MKFDALFNSNITTVNSAVGGRSIRTWMYSVQSVMDSDGECLLNNDAGGNPIIQDRWTNMLNNMKTGDYLFVQFGINDGSSTCDRHVGTVQYQIELGIMAEAAQNRGARPIFLTPVSMIKCSGSEAVGSRGFIDATFQAGEDYGVPVIDLHQLSVDLCVLSASLHEKLRKIV